MNLSEGIQAGVVVISLFIGAVGSWFTFENRVSNLERSYEDLPAILSRLNTAVEQLNLNVAKLEVRQEYIEKEKGR